jgi:hypothetical protein
MTAGLVPLASWELQIQIDRSYNPPGKHVYNDLFWSPARELITRNLHISVTILDTDFNANMQVPAHT